jgi:hypothetical protein
MGAKTIPAKTILICDRCDAQGERAEGPFGNGGTHAKKVEMWARGYDGAAGGISQDIDLCSSCSELFRDFLGGKQVPAIKTNNENS